MNHRVASPKISKVKDFNKLKIHTHTKKNLINIWNLEAYNIRRRKETALSRVTICIAPICCRYSSVPKYYMW